MPSVLCRLTESVKKEEDDIHCVTTKYTCMRDCMRACPHGGYPLFLSIHKSPQMTDQSPPTIQRSFIMSGNIIGATSKLESRKITVQRF